MCIVAHSVVDRTPTPPLPATPAQPPRDSILSLELVLVAAILIIAVSLIAIYLRIVRW